MTSAAICRVADGHGRVWTSPVTRTSRRPAHAGRTVVPGMTQARSTLVMSTIARAVPRIEPDTLETVPAARGW